MKENFLYIEEKDIFIDLLESEEITINDDIIVFIEETKEVWTHGSYFDGSSIDLSDYYKKGEIDSILNVIRQQIANVDVTEQLKDYALKSELPVNVSELNNDKGYLTEHQDISHLASRNWVESQGYAHQEDLLEISFNDIQDSPISIDDSGMINFVDESGNVGFQINEEGLRVTDVIAGEHKLSEKANASDIPSLDGYVKTEDIPSLDGLVKSEDLPNFDEFAKTEDIPSLDGYAKTSDIPSLDGYAKTSDIPSLDGYASKEWVNNRNYATEYDLKTIDYSTINNVPTLEDETGELNIADESGNIGMKVASEAVYAKDFVAGEHKLSEKVDKTYVDNSIAELVDGAPETLDTLNELAAALNDNADIVDVLNQSIGSKQDTITDLETIRQGAAKGATALQSHQTIATGSTNGTIKVGNTDVMVKGLDNLMTINHLSIFGGGNIDLASSSQIRDLQPLLVSGTNIKTINGESILGSGDIEISGGSSDANVQAVDTGDVLDDVAVEYVTKSYFDSVVGDINSVLESIINGGANTQQENPILYGLPTRAAEYDYFYSLYPVESDITITADYYHPSKGDQTLVCHISKGNTKIDETLTAA